MIRWQRFDASEMNQSNHNPLVANRTNACDRSLEANRPLSIEASEFLNDLIDRCLRYFQDASHSDTGLVADRGKHDGSCMSEVSSIAACGFGLSAYAIAAETGRMSANDAAGQVKKMLWSLTRQADHFQGIAYHFIAANSGTRLNQCEASTIDTALLVAGALHASVVFESDKMIHELTTVLYERANWNAFVDTDRCLHMGWTPESGFTPAKWDQFSEHPILLLLAIASPTHPIPKACWLAWQRKPVLRYDQTPLLSYPPLFVHQYPWAYFDVRGAIDPTGWDFWRNSQLAHCSHVRYLQALAKSKPETFSHYGNDLWGLTSSDSPTGYRDWGGPFDDGWTTDGPANVDRVVAHRGIDGTIVPSAAGGALAIVPDLALNTLIAQRSIGAEEIYGRYGFVNAFHPKTGWRSSDVIGIDTGITMLMAHNLLCGGVWNAFMAHPAAANALKLAGFRAQDCER
ncbi:glucoamylase family protein [Roseiconus lacunae]|uniref:glucoamylase family protein n=2 Tax=Roseiconus lacunae TaxID=2605694 RepID=UPI001F1D879E|nr:glucoamylase family protein [Roseiconus lacunae]